MRTFVGAGLALSLVWGCATADGAGRPVQVTLELFEFDAGHRQAVELALAGGESAVEQPPGVTACLWRPEYRGSFRGESVRFPSRRISVQSIRLEDGAEGLLQVVEHPAVAFDLPVPRGAGAVLTGAGVAVRPRRGADGAFDVEITPWFQVLRGPTLRMPEGAARLRVPRGWALVLAAGEPGPVAEALLFSRSPRGLRRAVAVLSAE